MNPTLLSIRQVADATALSERFIRDAINEGKLIAKNVGRSDAIRPTLRIRPADLEAWAESLENVIA